MPSQPRNGRMGCDKPVPQEPDLLRPHVFVAEQRLGSRLDQHRHVQSCCQGQSGPRPRRNAQRERRQRLQSLLAPAQQRRPACGDRRRQSHDRHREEPQSDRPRVRRPQPPFPRSARKLAPAQQRQHEAQRNQRVAPCVRRVLQEQRRRCEQGCRERRRRGPVLSTGEPPCRGQRCASGKESRHPQRCRLPARQLVRHPHQHRVKDVVVGEMVRRPRLPERTGGEIDDRAAFVAPHGQRQIARSQEHSDHGRPRNRDPLHRPYPSGAASDGGRTRRQPARGTPSKQEQQAGDQRGGHGHVAQGAGRFAARGSFQAPKVPVRRQPLHDLAERVRVQLGEHGQRGRDRRRRRPGDRGRLGEQVFACGLAHASVFCCPSVAVAGQVDVLRPSCKLFRRGPIYC